MQKAKENRKHTEINLIKKNLKIKSFYINKNPKISFKQFLRDNKFLEIIRKKYKYI